ncbi:MAG: hypothetical protein A2505_02920 [Deltaproteobacteria bacterium RIFOXYD12_FULL_55_16]|nr:MAG: hypothetical protein A2505_02920 [Deltaproteobacteria bacterium RIFOXYD12_FULL_55_16]
MCRHSRNKIIACILIALVGFIFQLSLQQKMRPYAREGLYYQQWSSEFLMQTVSIEDLRRAPLQTLSHLHIQPPALDVIRAALANIWNTPDPYILLRNVDRSLYVLWAVLYGLLGAFIFLWLSQLTRPGYAVVTALFFLAHPAAIFYATLLDGTLLSTVLILCAYYFLWRLRENPQKSIVAFTVAVLALFFTRSIFQWPTILLFAFSLLLLRVPRRKVVIFLAVCGVIVGLYVGKQYSQFGITSTSSFTGLNLEQSIGRRVNYMGYYWNYLNVGNKIEERGTALPEVLTSKRKLEGTPNFNHISYLALNSQLIHDYKERLAAASFGELSQYYRENARLYFEPSSRYTRHVIVDRLFWRDFYDRLFSAPVLPLLFLLAVIVWGFRAQRGDCLAGIALALPGLFVFLVSVLFEKGENMRFKFFLEPVYYIFIASQIYAVGELIRRKATTLVTSRLDDGP